MLFTDLPLCDSLMEGLQAMNFKEATPVQEQAIPVILEKKDVIACAQTGTGKTAAFLLPLLNNLQTDEHEEGKVNAIIMAPTRELAQQIDQQMEGFSYYTPFSSVAVYGGNDGEAWDVQKRGLLSGADVVIATPGRLLSHINLYNIDFSEVKYFILDEADRMLDMGFHEDIMKIEKLLPKDRQTVMFSATMPTKIQQLAKTILRDPAEITIAISRPPETILQSAYICHESQKIGIVKHLFKEKKPNKVLLFSGSKMKVKEIAKTLRHMGLSAGEMHSDLDQTQRNHVMHEFRNERVDILVATDIVARGIDIDDITLVINFDVPYDAEDYVHRIGRTARAGDTGMAITFVSPDEQYRFSLIEKFLQKQIYRIPVPAELGEIPEYNPVRDQRRRGAAARSSKGGTGRKGKGGGRKEQKSGSVEKLERESSAERPERQERSERPERSKRTDRSERSAERPVKGSRTEGEEKHARPERPERPRRTDRTKEIDKGKEVDKTDESRGTEGRRSSGNQKNSGDQGASGNQKRPRDQRGSGDHKERIERADRPRKSRKPRPPRDKETTRQEGSSEKVGATRSRENIKEGQESREKQAPRKQKERTRTGHGHDGTLKQETSGKQVVTRKQKGAVSPRTSDPTPVQESTTDKRKKWSWWPFGKK